MLVKRTGWIYGKGGKLAIIADGVLVNNTALSLPRSVCDPNASNTDISPPCLIVEFLPQRFIKFLLPIRPFFRQARKKDRKSHLGKPIGVTSYNSNIAIFGIRVIFGCVLLHVYPELLILGVGCCAGVFSYVGGLDGVLCDGEGGHDGLWMID